jgi:hypothetical protein
MLAPLPAGATEKIEFNRDIRPILSDNCFFCHGPDKKQRQADLRLDEREAAVASQAIVPSKPDKSGIIARIFSSDGDEMMPPAESPKRLTSAQKELLRRWVAEGAEYQGHWAYLPPKRPAVPKDRSAIDYLVGKRLQQIGLTPATEADRRTLARRLSFDLVGLPPRAEDVDAFVEDRSTDAYDRLLEQLLDSPHYGERMAIGWLDIVRFADTIGYHSDTPRNVWPYRDYVIQAFNSNKPFDQFTIEQLAGDLLPDPTQEQLVASCFNRLLLTTEEGGAQAKDYEARMLGDRVRAVGTVWLGQTLGCCQCHDHKFDPASTRDFYSLGAFFADVREPAIGKREEGMNIPDPQQTVELARLARVVDDRQKELSLPRPELTTAQQEWESTILAEQQQQSPWKVIVPAQADSDGAVKLQIANDGSISADRSPRKGQATYRITLKDVPSNFTGLRLEALADPKLPGQGPGRAKDGTFVLSELSIKRSDNRPLRPAAATATFATPGFTSAAAIDGKSNAANGWNTLGVVGTNQALEVEIAQPAKKEAADEKSAEKQTIVVTLAQLAGEDRVLGHFRLLITTEPGSLSKPVIATPPAPVFAALKVDATKRSPAQVKLLADYYRLLAPALVPLRLQLATAQQAKIDFEKTLPKCLVSVSQSPRTVRILPRGNWLDESGEIVEPALPQYLLTAKQTPSQRLTRLDLARWIVSRDNPLTARVTMNRLWKQFFGIGLSKSLEDLGSQGELPADAALLDWLACEFMDSGWDLRHMVREIVSSRTYRQASVASKELLVRDPEDRLLARQGRFRLDAELVRDNALSIAGLLVLKVGGPSAKPYQPDGYWENLNFPPRVYQPDKDENQYRRGLYTWWQRSFVHPSMLAFDVPTREECAAERSRANIPQQALALLNDPSYVEAARAFAARTLAQAPAGSEARITWMYRQALQRTPRADELSALRSLVEKHLAEYAQHEAAARELLQVGLTPAPKQWPVAELAAWTSAARVLLNLHETITRN